MTHTDNTPKYRVSQTTEKMIDYIRELDKVYSAFYNIVYEEYSDGEPDCCKADNTAWSVLDDCGFSKAFADLKESVERRMFQEISESIGMRGVVEI